LSFVPGPDLNYRIDPLKTPQIYMNEPNTYYAINISLDFAL